MLDGVADPDAAARQGPDTQSGGILKILPSRAFTKLFEEFDRSNSRQKDEIEYI